MPARLNAKGPGEFIRDHLQEPSTGGRDYVGSMYQAYKDHLRSAGVRRLPWMRRAVVLAPAQNAYWGQGTQPSHHLMFVQW